MLTMLIGSRGVGRHYIFFLSGVDDSRIIRITAAAIFVDCRVMLEAPELATIIEEAAMNIEDYLRRRRIVECAVVFDS